MSPGTARRGRGYGGRAAAPRARTLPGWLAPLLAATAILYGIFAAQAQSWLCDDAFISFRYAQHLVQGLGLVYNAAERVEGYSNFLWTLWIAAGMRLGLAPESWSIFWGIACYAATLALLCAPALREGRGALPLAGVLAALHPDWNIFATSGLETSLFTLLATASYFAAARSPAPRAAALAGLLLALTALARPDGVLFLPVVAAYVGWQGRPRVRAVLALLGVFLAIWIPYMAWKIAYYGDWLTNTYYAKSAWLAWWAQGALYARLYFQKYWVLATALPLAAVAAWRRRLGAESALAAAMAVLYGVYVLRVGGDFMFARLLLPVTPFLLILLEKALRALAPGPKPQLAALAAGGLAVALTPYPFTGSGWVGGIVNERELNGPAQLAEQRRQGEILRRYFAGTPIRIAIVGSQARLAYYARPDVAIEAQTGLTDRWIARQPITRRGRIGHEKVSPVTYLVSRRVDFVIDRFAAVTLDVPSIVAAVPIYFDGVVGYVVHWEPEHIAEMVRRGAAVQDFGKSLDAYEAHLASFSDEKVRRDFTRFRAFYFDFVPDSTRLAPFYRRLPDL